MSAVTASTYTIAIPGYSHLHPEPTPPSPPRRKRGRPPQLKAIVLGPKRRKGRPQKHVPQAADEDGRVIKRRVGRPRKDKDAGGVLVQFGKFVSIPFIYSSSYVRLTLIP